LIFTTGDLVLILLELVIYQNSYLGISFSFFLIFLCLDPSIFLDLFLLFHSLLAILWAKSTASTRFSCFIGEAINFDLRISWDFFFRV